MPNQIKPHSGKRRTFMTRTSMRAVLQEIFAWILIGVLLPAPGLAQENQPPAPGGPGGANNPQVPRAAEVPAKIEEQRRLNLAKLRERARDLQGPTVIDDVAFAQQTLAGLVLVRDVYIQQLRTFINQAKQWKTLTRGQKREIIRALDQYNANYIMTGSIAPPSNRVWKCDAEAQAYLRMATEFQGLLSVGPPGMFSSTFSDVLLKSSRTDPDKLVETFDQYLDYGIQGARDEIWRVQPIDTVAGISEFLAPQYQNTWAAAANLYGKLTRDLISTLPEFASTYQAVRHEQKEIKRLKMAAVVGTICIVAMAAAPVAYLAGGQALVATGNAVGSAINLGATVVQFGYDGAEFYGVYSQMSNAQRGGGATESNPSGLQLQAYVAGAGMALDGFFIGMTVSELKNAVQGLKVVPGNAGSTGNLAPTASPATNAATAPTGGTIAGAATPGAVRGIEKASALGIPQREIDRALQMMHPAGATPETLVTEVQIANRIGQRFEGIDQLGALEKEALQAGVPQRAIQSAFARARSATSDQLAMFGVKLPAALRTLTAQAKRASVVVDRAEIAEYVELTGLPANAVIERDVLPLMITSAKLSLMRMGRRSRWSAEDIQLLRSLRSFPNRANLYAFTHLEDGETTLVRLFNEEQLQTADQFFNSVNRQAIARGEATLPRAAQRTAANTLPLFPPTELANPITGEWITSREVSALSPAQLQRLSPEVVQSLNDGALKTALTDRLMAEAAKINANPAVWPPPQIGPAQLSWAAHTLFVLGGGVPNAQVSQLQPQDGDFSGTAPTGNSPGGAGDLPAGNNASNDPPRNDGFPQTPMPPGKPPAGSGNVPDRPSDPGTPSATANDTQRNTSPGTSAPSKDVPPPSRHQLEESNATPVPQKGGEKKEAKLNKLYDDNKSPQAPRNGTPSNSGSSNSAGDGSKTTGSDTPGAANKDKPGANPIDNGLGPNEPLGSEYDRPASPGAANPAGSGLGPTAALGSTATHDLTPNEMEHTPVSDLTDGDLEQIANAGLRSLSPQRRQEVTDEINRRQAQQSQPGYSSNGGSDFYPSPETVQAGKSVEAAAESEITGASQWPSTTNASGTRTFTSPDGQRIITVVKVGSGWVVYRFVRTHADLTKDLMNRPLGEEPQSGARTQGDEKKTPPQQGGSNPRQRARSESNPMPVPQKDGGKNQADEDSLYDDDKSPQTPPAGTPEEPAGTPGGRNGAQPQGVNDIPLPPDAIPDLTNGKIGKEIRRTESWAKAHLYTNPDTGKQRWIPAGGKTNPPGEPIGWWGQDPKTGQVTWHPRQFPPPLPPGKWVADPNDTYHFIQAMQLPPNSSRHIRLRVENKCPKRETFQIQSEGLPANLVQSSEEISIEANKTHHFLLTINSYGLDQGKYDGNLVVVCTSCAASACRQLRSVFPQPFLVTQAPDSGVFREPVSSSERPQSDGMGRSAPNTATEDTTQQKPGAEDSAQPAEESPL
jgi:hypothetical protein